MSKLENLKRKSKKSLIEDNWRWSKNCKRQKMWYKSKTN